MAQPGVRVGGYFHRVGHREERKTGPLTHCVCHGESQVLLSYKSSQTGWAAESRLANDKPGYHWIHFFLIRKEIFPGSLQAAEYVNMKEIILLVDLKPLVSFL